MFPASLSTNVTTHAIIIAMVGGEHSLLDRAKVLFSGPSEPTLFSSGDGSSMTAGMMASTAPYFVMKARTRRVSLSDKLTQSLITSGLVRGITPTSTRKQLGEPVRVIASFELGGADAAGPDQV